MSESFKKYNKMNEETLQSHLTQVLNQKYDAIEKERPIPQSIAKALRHIKAALRAKGLDVEKDEK